jgi:ABC-type polysaccharide/polyol phosphate transport system ATPase subunit
LPLQAVKLSGIGKQYPLQGKINPARKKDFNDFWALKDISFAVSKGEVVGVIGRNGAGKTTLLNIIVGTLSPTQGEISIQGRVLGLFNLGVGFQDELSGRENIFLNGSILGAARKELELKFPAIVEFSELGDFINLPLGTYSQGMRLRLAFAIVASLEFDVFVIDEVLAVGDALFQNKCFQRLMDFRRAGKTIIFTSQSVELAERLSNKIFLLDHGRLLFAGEPTQAANRYRAILNSETFFVGPVKKAANLVTDTKKWADDISDWGSKLGVKEIEIDSVELINRFGLRCNKIKSREALRIKVKFSVRDEVKQPHFGVAIFRDDGVYCYGPNTELDGIGIPVLKNGKGCFQLHLNQVLLAPGIYRISIAIWDKHETLAFDYHNGYYRLEIKGENLSHHLSNISFGAIPAACLRYPDLKPLEDKWGQDYEDGSIKISAVKLLGASGEERDVFYTNEPFRLKIVLLNQPTKRNLYQWVGIYREDGVYCQGLALPLPKHNALSIFTDELALLPGKYVLSLGIWDESQNTFLSFYHGKYPFRMVFDRADHGTVYLSHHWKIGAR